MENYAKRREERRRYLAAHGEDVQQLEQRKRDDQEFIDWLFSGEASDVDADAMVEAAEMYGRPDCAICGERFTGRSTEEVGEFYRPDDEPVEEDGYLVHPHYIAHAICAGYGEEGSEYEMA